MGIAVDCQPSVSEAGYLNEWMNESTRGFLHGPVWDKKESRDLVFRALFGHQVMPEESLLPRPIFPPSSPQPLCSTPQLWNPSVAFHSQQGQAGVPSAGPCPHAVHTRLIMKPIPFTSVIFIFNEHDSKTITLISQIPQTVNGARGN